MKWSTASYRSISHPNDYRHFESLLRHQINVWGAVVDRVRLTLDLHNSESGRYRSESFADNLRRMRSIIRDVSRDFSFITVDEVDTSAETRRKVARKFFNKEDLPIKAWDGGPFYSYLFGLWKARGRTVIHMDSDMIVWWIERHVDQRSGRYPEHRSGGDIRCATVRTAASRGRSDRAQASARNPGQTVQIPDLVCVQQRKYPDIRSPDRS